MGVEFAAAVETPDFCVEDLQGDDPNEILQKMADAISDKVQWTVDNKPDLKNIYVLWINRRHPKNNPDGNIGFFRVISQLKPFRPSQIRPPSNLD